MGQDTTQEWKTYINPEYKFTLQYPKSDLDSSVHEGVTPNVILFDTDPYTMLEIDQLHSNETIMNYTTKLLEDALFSIPTEILYQISHTKFASVNTLTFTTYDDQDVTKYIILNRMTKYIYFFRHFNWIIIKWIHLTRW